MKIIVIKGNGSSGKTTSLKLLIEKLCQDPRVRLYDKSRNFYDNMTIPERDLWAKFCYGGIHILIITYGDSAKDVADLIRRKRTDCDIVVCAAHLNYNNYFSEWENQNIKEMEKTRQQNDEMQKSYNEKFVDDLLKELIALAENQRKILQKNF